MTALALRTVFSLAAVLGLLLLLTRFAGRRYRAGTGTVRVLHRQSLSRGSAVTVVAVGRRLLVLGATEQQVRVLTELEPSDLEPEIAEEEAAPLAAVAELPRTPRRRAHLAPVAAPEPTGPYADFAAQLLAEVAPTKRSRPSHERPSLVHTPGDASGDLLGLDELLGAFDGQSLPAPPSSSTTPSTRRTAMPSRQAPAGRHAARGGGRRAAPTRQTQGALAGSLLSPQTWRQTWNALRRRAA